MPQECPGCRARVSFFRAIRTTAWGRFECKSCGSVLGISVQRRMVAIIPWILAILFLMTIVRVQDYGYPALLGTLTVTFLLIYYLLEKVVLIERRTFRCKSCGYDLRGLTEERCPECGAGFDPAEKSEILGRIGKPVPHSRYRWVIVLLIVLFIGTVVANLWTYYRLSAPRPPAAPTTTSPTSPPK